MQKWVVEGQAGALLYEGEAGSHARGGRGSPGPGGTMGSGDIFGH